MLRRGPLIAIIDDDEALRVALVGLVRSLGYRAQAFPDAEAFLAGARDGACIVSDIHMPRMSGVELKERLAAEGLAAPFIMITGGAERGLEARAFAAGAFCVLRKPFAAAALASCIRGALQRA